MHVVTQEGYFHFFDNVRIFINLNTTSAYLMSKYNFKNLAICLHVNTDNIFAFIESLYIQQLNEQPQNFFFSIIPANYFKPSAQF